MSQSCPKCNYVLGPFDTECPRCAQASQTPCQICGATESAGACAQCGGPICSACAGDPDTATLCQACAATGAPTPGPVGPPPAEAVIGNAEWLRHHADIIQGDYQWGVLLGLLFLNVLLALRSVNIAAMAIGGAILWETLALSRRAYPVAIALSCVQIGLWVAMPARLLKAADDFSSGRLGDVTTGAITLVCLFVSLGIAVYTILALAARRRYFH